MIIFAKDKRYDAKGDVQTETTIKSIKVADGGFRITESFSKRGSWLGFRRRTTYFLKVLAPLTNRDSRCYGHNPLHKVRAAPKTADLKLYCCFCNSGKISPNSRKFQIG
jgi:hypothetical protein